MELKKAPVDLAEIIAQSTSLVVAGEAGRLVQVTTNLLSNAIKYSPSQGVIANSASAERDDAVLRVRDEGIGIEPDLVPRIFDLFAQSAQSIERPQGASALASRSSITW